MAILLHDARHNPLGRFDGLASTYAKHRPNYPALAIDWILERWDRSAPLVDVGCGTGISSRQLAERGGRVIGVEPNESMRQEAEASAGTMPVEYQSGQGEATGLADDSVAGIVAAQAFHWFDGDAALREFHRILRAHGWVTLMWNAANLEDRFTAEFWSLLRQATNEPDIVKTPHELTGRILLAHPLFEAATERTTPHQQALDENGLLGRAFSASFAPRECGTSQRFAERLRDLFHAHENRGTVQLVYRTTVFQARRRS